MRPAGKVTGGAGEFGAGYRAQKRDFLGIGLSCLSDEAFVDAVRQDDVERVHLLEQPGDPVAPQDVVGVDEGDG